MKATWYLINAYANLITPLKDVTPGEGVVKIPMAPGVYLPVNRSEVWPTWDEALQALRQAQVDKILDLSQQLEVLKTPDPTLRSRLTAARDDLKRHLTIDPRA